MTTQLTIPGIPPLDRRRELQADLLAAQKELRDAEKDKREAERSFAEVVAPLVFADRNAPADLVGPASAYLAARDRSIRAEIEKGRIAAALAAEIARTEGNPAD